jgi:hypothetical protein
MSYGRTISPSQYTEAEIQVKHLLEGKGYLVQHWGYEHRFNEAMRDVIGRINKPTSLYIRTTPDLIVIGSTESLLLEVKEDNRENIALEAFPLLISRQLFWLFGIQTLYLFVNDNTIMGGFVETLPIGRVIIPSRMRSAERHYWLPLLRQTFPEIKPEIIPTEGSGDPYVIIFNTQRDSLRMWENLFPHSTEIATGGVDK